MGRWLATRGFHLLTGGGRGVMSSVSRAFYEVAERDGLVLGVLPADSERTDTSRPGYPNPWVEVPIRTHLSLSGERGAEAGSRNPINVLSSDVVVALPGSAGTSSEVRLAVRYGKPVVCFLRSRDEIPELPPEVPVESELGGVQRFVLAHLPPPPADAG